ncbi:zf-DHHC-domain-containing protein [Dacryopinax primogenitus]|uniref:Palmitoyltransferase n=1 Tax=Dacryopinax primogenitus (strain DJM 731) TaxID=1858805 RepID=M5G7T9_DACPD|nr:zf-DHHC-domain-containing protein [Dacryopinax primogenitus]EJU04195.1 zf-DHHC-domain-containing protein [Dacryopinax primogenitus]
MPNAQPPHNSAKPKTLVNAFTDTWNDARLRRAQRTKAAAERRAKRRKPQPWILRKLAVAVVLALLGWLQYVYVGRLCVPMIRRDAGTRGTFGQGVAYLIVYEVLWIIALWCYIKIITVPPGFAKDYIKKSPVPQDIQQPRATSPETFIASTQRTSSDTARLPLRPTATHPPPSSQSDRPDLPRTIGSTSSLNSSRSRGPIEFPENNPIARPFGRASTTAFGSVKNPSPTGKKEPSEAEAAPGFIKVHASRVPISNGALATNGANGSTKPPDPAVRPSWEAAPPSGEAETWADNLPPSRRPNHPVLTPFRRYCYKCELVKPYRSHHCSTCAQDVLGFDHHCLWVGQCVGARNRKFFINFLVWAVLLCAFTLATLLVANASRAYAGDLDGEMIAIIAIAGFFTMFTGALLSSHVWMLTVNLTTIEHMWLQTLQRRDTVSLSMKYSIWNLVGKGRQRHQWNQEWGNLSTEGNIWWRGSTRANWEATMGKSWLWWILPIGRSQSDGLSYPVNPRFSPEGRWRRRSEWPVELR